MRTTSSSPSHSGGLRAAAAAVAAACAAAVLVPAGGAGPAAAAPVDAASPDDALTLWYDEPATDWESETLPIGNGALGAAVFGGVATERLQLNEKTLWSGGPGSQQGYNFGNWTSPRPGAIKEVQERIDAEKRVDPGWVADKLGQHRVGYGSYQTLGDLRIATGHDPESVSGYRRDLDISDATAGVSFTADGVDYTREYFASAVDHVIVARISADEPGAVDITASIDVPGNRSSQLSADGGRITSRGALTDNGMVYETQVQVLADGGSRVDNADGSVTVSDADAVTLVLGAGTNYANDYPTYRGDDPHADVTAEVDAAAAKAHAELRSAHVADYRELFDRVSLDIGQRMPAVPTDELLDRYRDGAATPAARKALEALFFQYGRYLLVASSRAGSLPANLQGVWNNSTAAPWGADYHVNINLQMNYWLAETTNLSETTAPLFDYVDGMVEPGRVTAQEMFGNRGWVVHNETNPFGFTGVHDWATAFWFPESGAWLAQHYFEHYRFTQDERFLRERAYPVMKQLAKFWIDELVVDPRDGTLVVNPSYSPEHGDFSAGASMSQQIVWDLFTNVSEAAGVLGDDAFRAEAEDVLQRLDPGTRIGSWGQLQEWKEDWDDPKDTHRHVSHLFGLHPGRQISPRTTPEYAEAAEVSLTARGDGGTGWSKAWKINFWARLLDGNHAHTMLSEQLKNSTLDNLWDTHPPFQIDGNFGATAGVAEMLLQSQHGVVDVLPAVPDFWSEGSVTGLRARGDVTVDAEWANGAATRITLHPGQDGPLTVRSPMFQGRFHLVDTTTGHRVDVRRDGGEITFDAVAGHEYVATSQVALAVSAPGEVAWGESFETTVRVSAPAGRTVPAGRLRVEVPDGWSAVPASHHVLPLRKGESRSYTFEVTAGDGPERARIAAALEGDGWSARATTGTTTYDPAVIDQDRMSVVEFDSEETAAEDGAATNAIDGNPGSYWHTAWSSGSDPLPHHIVLDLGAVEDVSELTYLPRQNSTRNGLISDYEVYVSSDGETWGEPVASGTFPDSKEQQTVDLGGAEGRYLKLVANGSYVGPWTCVAELTVRRQVE